MIVIRQRAVRHDIVTIGVRLLRSDSWSDYCSRGRGLRDQIAQVRKYGCGMLCFTADSRFASAVHGDARFAPATSAWQ